MRSGDDVPKRSTNEEVVCDGLLKVFKMESLFVYNTCLKLVYLFFAIVNTSLDEKTGYVDPRK